MTGYEEFTAEYENLRAVFRATSRDIDEAHAKMAGTMRGIVPLADDRSLQLMAEALRETAKRETFKILSQMEA